MFTYSAKITSSAQKIKHVALNINNVDPFRHTSLIYKHEQVFAETLLDFERGIYC